MRFSQETRQARISTPLGLDELGLLRMRVDERLSQPFRYYADVVSTDPQLDPDSLLGQAVSIALNLRDGDVRDFHGYVTQFGLDSEGASQTYTYRLRIDPWLWFLTQTSDCQIFQNKTVPDIILEIFRQHDFTDVDNALTETYREWEYCVQYRETDFAFVQRLMEQEGIYYYFRHEKNKHTLVLCDGITAHKPLSKYEKIRFLPHDRQRDQHMEYVHHWSVNRHIKPVRYVLSDFNFETPKAQLLSPSGKQSRGHAHAKYELFDYPGEFEDAAQGERYSKIRLEEEQVAYEIISAASNARGLACGHLLTLTHHPQRQQNKEYLITDVQMTINNTPYETGQSGKDSFECNFAVLDSKTPYRAPRVTEKPLIRGPQTAIVTGKSGEEIYPDAYGRVKVQFFWDRYGGFDENSSCWIRVAHPIAGKKWGYSQLPRMGQEVLVEFLEGDPDRPIITGSVYNAETMPGYDLPANKTISGYKSNSSKGGDGFNEWRFEDAKGKEQVFLHAQRNLDVRVKNDRMEFIGANRHLNVEKDKVEHVKNERHETIDSHHKEHIAGNRELTVDTDEMKQISKHQSLTVDGKKSSKVGKDFSTHVKGDYSLTATNIVLEASSNITLKVGSNFVAIDTKGVKVSGSMGEVSAKGMLTLKGATVKIN